MLRGYGNTLDSVDTMFKEAKQYFPDLKRDDVWVSMVHKSARHLGHTIIHFHSKTLPLGKAFSDVTGSEPDYYFM